MIRRVALFVLVVAGLSLGAVAARAYWDATVNSGAAGQSTAASVNAATVPTANRTSMDTVALSWPAVVLSNGVTVDGYVVKRYNSSTLITQTVGGTCAGTVVTTSCTETGVPVGSWRYSVYPRIGANWTGTESPLTSPVVISAPVLALAKTYYNAPATTTGTVSGFGVNEAISYRLDAATALIGFPAVVDTTGGAPISSLSIPAMSDGTHTVYVLGANGSTVNTTITYDTVVPLISSSVSPAANGAGWNTTPVTVTLTATDAGSGINQVRYTTDGSDPTSSGTALTYGSPFAVNATATVRYYATDRAGNASALGSRVVSVDTTAPANSLALSSVTGAVLKSSTIYYKGSTTGSFAITNTVTDASSGPQSSTTSALGGTSTGFTHVPSTVSTPAGGPYVSNVFSWTASTSSAPTLTVTGADVAGNTTATPLTFANDSAAPTGVTVDAAGLTGTGSRYSTTTALSIPSSKGTDAGVGLATGALLQRATATLTTGVCGTYGSYTTVATDPSVPVADTVADQACYRYQYVVSDLLGNSTTQVSGDIKVDTTAPSAPTLGFSALTNTYASGTTVYFRGSQASGSFTVTASSTDAASGISGYTFPSLGTNWISTPGATGVNTYSWTTAPPAAGTPSVTATNNAFRTATTTMTLVNDSAAPAGSAPTYASAWLGSTSVTVGIPAATDALSGVNTAATQLQRLSATLGDFGVCGTYGSPTTVYTGAASSYQDNALAKGVCYKYQTVYVDNVGNTSSAALATTVAKVPRYTSCSEAITAANPDIYYRMADAGATATDSSGRPAPSRNGSYVGSPAHGSAANYVCGSGTTFNGTAQYISSTTSFTNPTTYSQEVWFKTATTSTAGRIVGFGSSSTGASGSYDRFLYMRADGTLLFGTNVILIVLPIHTELVTTPKYNDMNWHQAVITQSASGGMKIYVDGQFVIDDPQTGSQNYTGYFRVGWDTMAGWTGGSAADYFNGQVAHAAFWSTAELTPAQVYDHYIAGTVASPALLTSPSFVASAEASAFSIRRFAATISASAAPSSRPPRSPASPVPSRTPASPSPTPQPTTPSPGSSPAPPAGSSPGPYRPERDSAVPPPSASG